MPFKLVRNIIVIWTVLISCSAVSQELNYAMKKCNKSNLQTTFIQTDSVFAYSFPNDSLLLFAKSTDSYIDTIYNGIISNDTINRLHQKYEKDFLEMLPYLQLPDWGILPIMLDHYPDANKREKEFRKLTNTYRDLSPHLFGYYGNKYAIIPYGSGYNFIDRNGNIVYECVFQNLSNFIDGYAFVKTEGKWYKMNDKGYLFEF